jgi:hypothetical protein
MRWMWRSSGTPSRAEDNLAAGTARLRVAVQGPEPDLAAAQLGDQPDEVGQRSREPVEAGHHEGVAGAQVGQAGGELGPVGAAAGAGVGEHAQAAGFGEGAPLAVQELAECSSIPLLV